ncbi:hypothetical protein M3Y97_01020000 [Aphelenchoides bicaudatus]|nr:hypothetical protein M3Y97_01020000 [Aphelenchoides bicaudatus]
MHLRTAFILVLLVGATNGHLAMILGLVTKVLGGIIKMDMQIFGPMAMQGFQTLMGMLTKGFNGGGQIGGQLGGNGQGQVGGNGQVGGQFGGNGAGQGGFGSNGGAQGNGAGHGGFGFGFGGNGGLNGGANGGANGGGKGGFGFGGNGGLNGGANAGSNGASNGGGKGGFGFGGNAGANGGVNGGANGNASAGGGFFDSIVSGLRGILKQYAGIAGGLLGGSKSWAETVQSLVQGGIGNFFKIFGGLGASAQAAIGGLLAQSLEVFTTVLKLKMGGLQGIDSLIQSEIKVIKSIIEKATSNMGGIISSLGAQAPHISGTVSMGFKAAKDHYKAGYKKLDAPTKKGLDKMMHALSDARSKVGNMIETATPKHKSDMGVLFHVIKNVHGLSMKIH